MPLQQLSITGLLSFGEETVFEFGQLNLLIGPNGSGKSNLLNCIRILRLAPLDIQQAFQDSGFEDWRYKGAPLNSASLEAKLNAPEPVHHRLRFLPQSASRAALEEVISQGDSSEANAPFFIGSHRGGATLSTIGKTRRVNRTLNADEYNPLASILAQIRDAGQYPEITHLANL